MDDTRIWICPALCGCEIEMNAFWTDELIMQGDKKVSYRHPACWTIRDMKIINACVGHEHYKSSPLLEDPYFGAWGYLRLTTQVSKHGLTFRDENNQVVTPEKNPELFLIPEEATEAQRLYIHLYQYTSGTTSLDTCGCKIHQIGNHLTGEGKIVDHPVHTYRCHCHTSDVDHSVALKENRDKECVKCEVMKTCNLKEEEVEWKFEDDRSLTISSSKLGPVDKLTLATKCETLVTTKVNIQ